MKRDAPTPTDRHDGGEFDSPRADARLTDTDIHDVLRNKRRRLVLEVLQDASGPVSLGELSETIAAVETTESPPPRRARRSVYISLHQTHLPKLDDLAIVVYATQSKMIGRGDAFGELEAYLEPVRPSGDQWSEVYLVEAALGLLTVVASTLAVPVVTRIPPPAWAALSLLLIVGTALYHRSTT